MDGCVAFQSTPAIAGGRIHPNEQRSRHPRPFQSTPAIAGGRIAIQSSASRFVAVSIHARHCWRANPVRILQGAPFFTPFQSTPAIAGGRIRPLCNWHLPGHGFQSTPAIAGGRILAANSEAFELMGFNPRPPLLAGESPGSMRPRWLCNRFNPRPPLLAGESQRAFFRPGGTILFQSTPAIAGGRIPLCCAGCASGLPVSIHARHCWRANPFRKH